MKLINDNIPSNDNRLYLLYSRFVDYTNVYVIRPSGKFLFGYSGGMIADKIVVVDRDDTFPVKGELFDDLKSTYLLYELTEDETHSMISEIL